LPVDPLMHVQLKIPISDGRHISIVHASGRVLKSEMLDGFLHIDAELPESSARYLEEFATAPAQHIPAASTNGHATVS
jgi:hypothetical protein